MYRFFDPETQTHIFLGEKPRGITQPVEEVTILDYNLPRVHLFPTECALGRKGTAFKVFRTKDELRAEGYEHVPGLPSRPFGCWDEYLHEQKKYQSKKG